VQRRLDAERPVGPEKVASIQEWGTAMQERTRRDAVNAGTRWTEDEDEVVLALIDRPIFETCDELKRSLAAVSHRRTRLRQAMALVADSPAS
jgi:purine nucleoside phosphorylase